MYLGEFCLNPSVFLKIWSLISIKEVVLVLNSFFLVFNFEAKLQTGEKICLKD